MKMTLPRISVALCTYNGARYLKEQVDSMIAQSRLPDEVVVCDDGSKDATLDILEDFKRRAPFPVRIHRNEVNLKMTKNFEKCIGLCECELIALADFDDAWYPNKLEVLSQILVKNPTAGYVVSDADLMDGEGATLPSTRWGKASLRFLPKNDELFSIYLPVLFKQNIVCGSAMMLRASLRPFVLPISAKWAQDHWIATVATMIGGAGLGLTTPLMRYRLHATQAFGLNPSALTLYRQVRSSPDDMWKKDIAMFDELRETIRSHPELLQQCKESDLHLLDAKIQHLKQRDRALSMRGLARWRIVFAELSAGRYDQLSLSWKSVLRDLAASSPLGSRTR